MHTNVNWNDPLTDFTAVALLMLGAVQVWFIVRKPSLSPGRKWLRAGLNAWLWLLLLGYFGRFSWPVPRPATHALLIGDEVPTAFAHRLGDSLRIRERFTGQKFKTPADSVTVVGQTFPPETLARLSHSVVQWIPYRQPDQIQAIGWKGVVRQGEMQRVTGQIRSSRKQFLRLRYGNQTLDSVALREGSNAFDLRFPAFARGRTQTELVLENTPLDTVRFFARPTPPLRVQFLLNSPDFESKTLANWLGKQGHTVQLSTILSKNIASSVSINNSDQSASRPPDLIITEPANARDATVRRAAADGRSVLFINLTNPETDLPAINRALGSRWQVRKIANQPAITLGNGLNALPYRFADALNQFAVAGYPVAVQRTVRPGLAGQGRVGRVGVSLLNETFPIALRGDSLTYGQIWTAVLAQLSVTGQNNVQVGAPVFAGLPTIIQVNNAPDQPPHLRVGEDTLQLAYSPLNVRTAEGSWQPLRTGWQSIGDSVAVYVGAAHVGNPVADEQRVSRYMLAHARHRPGADRTARLNRTKLPGWVWLLLFLTCFTALWVEPKL